MAWGLPPNSFIFVLSCEPLPSGWRPDWNGVSSHFCADGPPCRKARSSKEEGPTVAQGQMVGRLENSKESLIIMVIFLTYFIQPWHFASRAPSNSTAVLRHHDGDNLFGCFQLLFLTLSKATCQQLKNDISKKACPSHLCSLAHSWVLCGNVEEGNQVTLYVTVTMFGMKNQAKLYATWQNYWGKQCCRLHVLMQELLSVSELMILWFDADESELNASLDFCFP